MRSTDVAQSIAQVRLDTERANIPITTGWAIAMFLVGLMGGAVGGVLGAARYARSFAKQRIQEAIDKVDPTAVTVRVPEAHATKLRPYLTRFGFRHVETYRAFDRSCLDGCVVVVPSADDDKALFDRDIAAFREFLRAYTNDATPAAYVIYTTRHRVPEDIVDDFAAITFANAPATIGPALLTLARLRVGAH